MTASPAAEPSPARRRIGFGATLLLIALGIWALLFAVMWAPSYAFGDDGVRYALWPLIMLSEIPVLGLAIAALAVAISEAARRRIGPVQTAIVTVGSGELALLGPVLLWFGTIPLISPAALFG